MPTLRSLRNMEDEDEKKRREREERIAREREQRAEMAKINSEGGDTGALTWDEMGDLPPERPSEESLGAFTNKPKLVGEETRPGSGEVWQDVTEKPYWREPPPSEVSPGEGKMSMRDAFRENVINNVFSGNDPYLLEPEDVLDELTPQYPEIWNDTYGIRWADRDDAPPDVKKDWSNRVLRMRSDAFKFRKSGIDMRKKALDDMMKQFDEAQGEKVKEKNLLEKERRAEERMIEKEKRTEERTVAREGRVEGRSLEREGRTEDRTLAKEKRKKQEKGVKEPTSTQWNLLDKFEKENVNSYIVNQEKIDDPILLRWNRIRSSMGLPEMEGAITQEAGEGTGIAGLVGIGDTKELWKYSEKKEEEEKVELQPQSSSQSPGDNTKAELGYWKLVNKSPDNAQKIQAAFRTQYGYVPTRIPTAYKHMFK